MKNDRRSMGAACAIWLVVAAIAAADPVLDQARSAYLTQDYAAAAASLEAFVANNPGHAGLEEARHTLAASYDALGRYADAARAYRDLLKHHPLTAHAEKARFQLGHAMREERDWDEAIIVYRDYLERYPAADRRIEAEWEIAQCLFEARRYDELATYAGQLFSENPEHPRRSEWIFLQGRMLQDKGNYPEAIDKYLEYLAADAGAENDKRALLYLAKAMRAQTWPLNAPDAPTSGTEGMTTEFLDEQKRAYLSILLDQPDMNPEDRAWALNLAGEFAELERFSAEFLAANPQRNRVWLAMQNWLGIGQLQKNPRDIEAARATFDAVFQTDAASIPGCTAEHAAEHISRAADWLMHIARWEADEEEQQAIRDRLQHQVPDNNIKDEFFRKFSRLSFADYYFEHKDYAEIIRRLGEFLEQHPQAPEAADAWLMLARAHDHLNDFQHALDGYQEVLRQRPNHEKAAYLRYVVARKHDDLEQRETALERYQAFITEHPADENVGNAHYYIARNLEKLGRWNEAVEKYRSFLESYPESEHVEEARGYLQASLAQAGN